MTEEVLEQSKEKTKAKVKNGEKLVDGENNQITISMDEYNGLIKERDQLRVNLYLIATQLKDAGFNVSDQGNAIQKIGTEITNRLKLTPTQLQMIQQSVGQ